MENDASKYIWHALIWALTSSLALMHYFSTGHKMGEESGEDSAVLPQSGHFPGKGRNVGAAPEAFSTRRFGS